MPLATACSDYPVFDLVPIRIGIGLSGLGKPAYEINSSHVILNLMYRDMNSDIFEP